MGLRENPKGIWVRWPDGHVTNSDLPDRAGEVTVSFDGALKVTQTASLER
jgi:hypothetical protein